MAKICRRCRLQYNDNAQICSKCGSPLESVKNIQEPVRPQPVTAQQPIVQPQRTNVAPSATKKPAKSNKTVIGIIAAVVAVAILVCGILIIPELFNKDGENTSIFSGQKNSNSGEGLNLTAKFPGNTICQADNHIVAVKSDGTVISTKPAEVSDCGQSDVSDWTDIIAVSGGTFHTVGLKSDGTVVSTAITTTASYPEHGQTNVSDWTDITAISAESNHTVGLKKDGTVLAVGCNEHGECDVSDWTDIASVIADDHYTIGIKTDGSVVVAGSMGFDINSWTNIVDITIGWDYAIGLKSDGTLVIDATEGSDISEISGWSNIVAVETFSSSVVGLKSDGTLIMSTNNERTAYTKDDISGWTDIVAFDASRFEIVALKSDGTVLSIGNDEVKSWTDIKTPQ